MASDEIMAEYLAGKLDEETRERLEQEFLGDAEARAELLAQRQISAGLHALLGNSLPLQRGIVSRLCSESDDAITARIVAATVSEAKKQRTFGRTPWTRFARPLLKIAAVVTAAAASAALLRIPRYTTPLAVVKDQTGVEWNLSASAQRGTQLRRGEFEVKSGVLELELRSGAQVVVEGPASLALVNANEMTLRSGKLLAYVPPPATGFTVQTSSGAIVDLGTRFGVNVDASKTPEVHVVEGKVEVQNNAGEDRLLTKGEAVAFPLAGSSAFSPLTFAPEFFPRPGIVLDSLLVGGGFEDDSLVAIDYAPRQYGLWSGDPAMVVTETDDVHPRSGKQMLRFEVPESGKPFPCQQWQVVDLAPIRRLAGGARAEAVVSVWFNRSLRAAGHPSFGVSLAAFKGDPAQAPHFWAARQEKAVAMSENFIQTDTDPETWEKAEARIKIPGDADFLLVEIAANSPVAPELVSSGPNGHYADDVTLEVHIAPQAGSADALASN